METQRRHENRKNYTDMAVGQKIRPTTAEKLKLIKYTAPQLYLIIEIGNFKIKISNHLMANGIALMIKQGY